MYIRNILFMTCAVLEAGRGHQAKRYHFDVIELNHKCDEYGRHCYDQIILWNWKPEVQEHHVEGWWLVDVNILNMYPRRKPSEFIVYKKGLFDRCYAVVGKVFIETTTVYDPERMDKEHWDERLRRLPVELYSH